MYVRMCQGHTYDARSSRFQSTTLNIYTKHSAALGLDVEDGKSMAALSYRPGASLGQIFAAGVEALQVGWGYR
jgi:uncharacterized protein YigE (DUF2233 family)